VAAPLSDSNYRFLREFLHARIGHDLGEGKEYLALSRLGTLVESRGLPSLSALFDLLSRPGDTALETAVAEAMVTGETTFFRTPAAFESLRRDVIPNLMRARAETRRLRIWSAGCSTGQEPYSIAFILAEHMSELSHWDVSILATDLSEHALRQARAGAYTDADTRRGLPPAMLDRHFHRRDDRWVVSPEIRKLVTFETRNLVDLMAFRSEFDVVMLKNVLIYFFADKKRAVLEGVRRAIKDDGYLFLGESETILGISSQFCFPPTGLEYYRPSAQGLADD
jgi:chemotaxis protein methyltransferase CheR